MERDRSGVRSVSYRLSEVFGAQHTCDALSRYQENAPSRTALVKERQFS
jgi:hypothetical protein